MHFYIYFWFFSNYLFLQLQFSNIYFYVIFDFQKMRVQFPELTERTQKEIIEGDETENKLNVEKKESQRTVSSMISDRSYASNTAINTSDVTQ